MQNGQNEDSFIIRLVKKCGAKTEQQVNTALITITVVAFLAAACIMIANNKSDDRVIDVPPNLDALNNN